ncbi:MAG: radical SAM family heme chaperone HemW [Planctomycetaceae bacterium]
MPSRPELAVPRAAYIHVPFCRHRCGYCNFTLIAGRDDLMQRYLEALARELALLQQPHEVDTLFFGGGTPTHLPPQDLTELLSLAKKWFPLAKDYELSVEANPLDLTPERCEVLQEAGVNRISLGVQSFQTEKLMLLERDHRSGDIALAVKRAQEVAKSVSLDLIFGVPGETLASWKEDLQRGMDLGVTHVSTYGLTFERGTQFWSRQQRGELAAVADGLEATLYETSLDMLQAAGYEHYEVSNFARSGFRCRHNETYWLGRPYFAAGPGAARYVNGIREVNHRSTTTYLARIQQGKTPVAEQEELPLEERARERLVFGLRRIEGVAFQTFVEETGYEILPLGGKPLGRFLAQGWMEKTETHLRLTRKGLLISDSLWPDLLVGE